MLHNDGRRARNGSITIAYETFGPPACRPISTACGMIAQTIAIDHPAPPRRILRAMKGILAAPVTDAEQAARREVAIYRLMGSPGYPLDEQMIADIGRRSYERHPGDPEGGRRQRAAVAASPDRRPALSALAVPALVVHGEEDVMMRPKAGRATAEAIAGARLVTYPGMGHDLPAPLWPSVVGEIRRLAADAS